MKIIRNPESNRTLKIVILSLCGAVAFFLLLVVALVVVVSETTEAEAKDQTAALRQLKERTEGLNAAITQDAADYEAQVDKLAKRYQAGEFGRGELLAMIKPHTMKACSSLKAGTEALAETLRDSAWPEETSKARSDLASLYDRTADLYTNCSKGEKLIEFYNTPEKDLEKLEAEEAKLTRAFQDSVNAWAAECGCVSGSLDLQL